LRKDAFGSRSKTFKTRSSLREGSPIVRMNR
jgi:hypothetical protein